MKKCPHCSGELPKSARSKPAPVTELRDGVTWYAWKPVRLADGSVRSFCATFPDNRKSAPRASYVPQPPHLHGKNLKGHIFVSSQEGA